VASQLESSTFAAFTSLVAREGLVLGRFPLDSAVGSKAARTFTLPRSRMRSPARTSRPEERSRCRSFTTLKPHEAPRNTHRYKKWCSYASMRCGDASLRSLPRTREPEATRPATRIARDAWSLSRPENVKRTALPLKAWSLTASCDKQRIASAQRRLLSWQPASALPSSQCNESVVRRTASTSMLPEAPPQRPSQL
jgi:hypothetical protein